jgi:hypothetical protein
LQTTLRVGRAAAYLGQTGVVIPVTTTAPIMPGSTDVVLTFDPNYADAYYQLGIISIGAGDSAKAKGCEWDVVYLIHATDGILPSDLATGDAEQIEEERRLLEIAGRLHDIGWSRVVAGRHHKLSRDMIQELAIPGIDKMTFTPIRSASSTTFALTSSRT